MTERIPCHIITEFLVIQNVSYNFNKKTSTFNVLAKRNKVLLGVIKWYAQWRQYCFFPTSDTIFNHQCLDDINITIKELNRLHKKKCK